MHCIETIIVRNAEAAGRAASDAYNDGDKAKGDRIVRAHDAECARIESEQGVTAAVLVDSRFVKAYGKAQDAEPRRPLVTRKKLQFTPATCPGRPCSTECDHVGWV